MERASRFFKLLSLALFIMSACVCVCVVRVYADDTATYFQASANECYTDWYYNEYGSIYVEFDSDVRVIRIKNYNGSNSTVYAISLSSFKSGKTNQSNNPSCPVPNTNSTFNSSNNNIPFDFYYTALFTGITPSNIYNVPFDIVVPDYVDSTSALYYAYYYTYGDGAIDPVEPVNWGLVDLEGYQTNIAGQGQAAINNVDVISWNSVTDTLGNDISAGDVRIRFVPGEYTADTKNSLLQRLYSDFVLDVLHATDGGVFPVSDGSASFQWSDIIDTLNLPFASIYSLINENDAWFKRGWVYQIRLEIDDYEGEWQTVYASTSSGVNNDLTIVNTTTVTQNTLTAIQNINSINQTTNIWIVYETPVDPNPEYQQPESDDEKPWWVYLLEMINNSIGVTNEYISEGTDESVQIVNNMNNEYNDLDTTVNEYDDIEGDLLVNLEDNLDDLDVDSDLISSNGFLNSARWISEQFTRLTTDNPIGSILKFSLVLGFVMIFLGRFR